MWNSNNVFALKPSSNPRAQAFARLMLCLFLLIICLLGITGCGGGGGGGSSGGSGGPVDYRATIGTVEFSSLTSRNIDGLETPWPVGQTWMWTWTDPAGPSWTMTQDFSTDTVYIPSAGVTLPVYKMLGTSTEGGITREYAYWAVARDGNLYTLTNGPKGVQADGTTHVLTAQPRLVARKTYTVSGSWTDGVPGNLGGTNDPSYTRVVIGKNVTSPAGFTGCVHIRISPVADPNGIETVDEYWKDGYGIVEENTKTTGGVQGDKFVRQGIAFSG